MNVALIIISLIGECFGLLCLILYCKKKPKKNIIPIPISQPENDLNENLVLQPKYILSSPKKNEIIYPTVPQFVFPEVPQQAISFPKVPTQPSEVSSNYC